jgi:hypothetical protein
MDGTGLRLRQHYVYRPPHQIGNPVQGFLTVYNIPRGRFSKFTSNKTFHELILERAEAFLGGRTSTQYFAIGAVKADNVPIIDYGRICSDLPGMRILYDQFAEMLVVKLMAMRPMNLRARCLSICQR